MNYKKYFWLVIVIFSLGLFFRIYRYESYPFGFDQIQILENSKNILSGDLTLIGPRTGRVVMFTGPFIYYLHALVSVFFSSIYSLVILAVIMSAATGMGIYSLFARFFDKERALLAFGIWAISPYIIQLDRVAWNPSLMLLATVLSLLPLYRKKLSKIDYLFLLIGSFLGFQAHFSGLLLPFLISLFSFYIYGRREFIRISLMGFLGLGISLIPSVVFDLRNDWLNMRGFLSLFSGSVGGSVTELISGVWNSLWISVENVGKIFLLHNAPELIHSVGLLVLCGSGWLIWKKKNRNISISLWWIFLIGVGFGFYSESKPEYYYLIQIPAIFVLYIELFMSFVRKKLWWVLGIFTYLIWINLMYIYPSNDMELGNQMRVVEYVSEVHVVNGISKISFDIEQGNEFGLKYLLSDIRVEEDGVHVHVSYPETVEYSSVQNKGNVYVWIDPRNQAVHSFAKESYIVLYPKDVQIHQAFGGAAGVDEYLVFEHGVRVGKIYIEEVSRKGIETIKMCGDCMNKWRESQSELGDYVYVKMNSISYYLDDLERDSDVVESMLEEIVIY